MVHSKNMLVDVHRLSELIFELDTPESFETAALQVFRWQAEHNAVYSEYLRLLKKSQHVSSVEQIPFLPVEFFKQKKITTGDLPPQFVFESSGTAGQIPSRHYIADIGLYIKSLTRCFEIFFGKPSHYCIVALLPSYLERKNSSLVFMADKLMAMSGHPLCGFFSDDFPLLAERLRQLEAEKQMTILLGVSFALLDFARKFPMKLKHVLIMETGGMKGRRKEITRQQLHAELTKAFGVEKICSEYGMTELLSQAYAPAAGIFKTPPWMKILIRNPYDPFEYLPQGSSGAINVVDLANIYSCAFIQTDDTGRLHGDGSFEVEGRLDHAELRGCNLLLE